MNRSCFFLRFSLTRIFLLPLLISPIHFLFLPERFPSSPCIFFSHSNASSFFFTGFSLLTIAFFFCLIEFPLISYALFLFPRAYMPFPNWFSFFRRSLEALGNLFIFAISNFSPSFLFLLSLNFKC